MCSALRFLWLNCGYLRWSQVVSGDLGAEIAELVAAGRRGDAELSRSSGVSIPTIKFYLPEGVLCCPPADRSIGTRPRIRRSTPGGSA